MSMRPPADAGRVRRFMEFLGRHATRDAVVYMAGGATAVLEGWRATTRDIDLRIEPEAASGALGEIIVRAKDELQLNVEFASPVDFMPELPGWRERSPFVGRHGALTFRHVDFYAQALAKVQRDIEHDADDVAAMLSRGLISRGRAWELYEAIVPALPRFPVIDEPSFRARMERAFGPAR